MYDPMKPIGPLFQEQDLEVGEVYVSLNTYPILGDPVRAAYFVFKKGATLTFAVQCSLRNEELYANHKIEGTIMGSFSKSFTKSTDKERRAVLEAASRADLSGLTEPLVNMLKAELAKALA